jgi:hypothetical protein
MTRNDVRTGIPGRTTACPVALAVTRATGIAQVGVGQHYMLIGGYQVRTGPEVRAFISAYDSAGPERVFMPPITFELELPDG